MPTRPPNWLTSLRMLADPDSTRDQGWLAIKPRSNEVVLAPDFHARLQHWIALEMVWTRWLVREA